MICNQITAPSMNVENLEFYNCHKVAKPVILKQLIPFPANIFCLFNR